MKASGSFFALALICFFFSFCEVKCTTGSRLYSVSGFELVKNDIRNEGNLPRNLMDADTILGSNEDFLINWALVSFVACIICLIFYLFVRDIAIRSTFVFVTGLVGLVALLMLQKHASDAENVGLVKLKFQPAYWIALCSLGLGTLLSVLPMGQKKRRNA